MVDGKGTKRTIETVQREYTQVCTQLGDIRYKISALEVAARNAEKALRQLNKEANRMQANAPAEEPQEAPVEQ